jgi:hypothetical protein
MYRFWILAVVAIVVAAPSVNAARRMMPASEKVTATFASRVNGNPNGCTNIPFAAICGSGDCVCEIYDGTASGALGQGAATVYLDIDILDPTGLGKGCYPVYGNVQFANMVLAITGSACGDSAKGSLPGTPLNANGSFIISENATAPGAMSGTIDINGNSVSLTFLAPPAQ